MNAKKILSTIDGIERSLTEIEDMMSWMVKSKDRFKVGQAVRFSKKAVEKGVAYRRKRGVQTGRVVEVSDLPRVKILLDGYKVASWYHQSFFDPVRRRTVATLSPSLHMLA